MKKLLATFVVLALVFSLAACGEKIPQEKQPEKGKQQDAKVTSGEQQEKQPEKEEKTAEVYVKECGKKLAAEIDGAFASKEVSCKTSVKSEGNKIIVDIKAIEIESVDEKKKKAFNNQLDTLKEELVASFNSLKSAVPNLEAVSLNFSDKNGKSIAEKTLSF